MYRQLGEYDQANKSLESALEKLEKSTEIKDLSAETKNLVLSQALNNLAVVCIEQGRYEEAIPHFERSLDSLKNSCLSRSGARYGHDQFCRSVRESWTYR